MGKRKLRVSGLAVTLLFFVLCAVLTLRGVRAAEETRRTEARRVMEESLRRAVMSCYALEGRYPPTLDYVVENYGLYLDEDCFFVDYRVFASNMMPEITVLERK